MVAGTKKFSEKVPEEAAFLLWKSKKKGNFRGAEFSLPDGTSQKHFGTSQKHFLQAMKLSELISVISLLSPDFFSCSPLIQPTSFSRTNR